nr:hypothetical protein [Paenibacillus sp. SYP-B3998]
MKEEYIFSSWQESTEGLPQENVIPLQKKETNT